MGYRVPMTVVSPFSRGGHIASEVFDHTSQLRFLEERFGVRAPNLHGLAPPDGRRCSLTLHMHSKDVSAPVLPPTSKDHPANVMAEGCNQGDILEITDNQPDYPVPLPQTMPRQEPTGAV